MSHVPRVKLVKVDEQTVELINYGAVNRVERRYRVDVDGEPVGFVQGHWGVESGYLRSSVQPYWTAHLLDGVGLGWETYRSQAVELLLRKTEVAA